MSTPGDRTPAAFSRIRWEDDAMFPLKTILLPTNYSVASKTARALACNLAHAQGAHLIGLNVIGLDVIWPPRYSGPSHTTGAAQSGFQDSLDQWLRQPCGQDDELSVESRVIQGIAWEEIVRAAGESRCDLIVMGSAGKSGVGRALEGSVAEAVARHAPCPVLICKAPATRQEAPAAVGSGRPLFSTILLPTDLSDRAGEAFAVASALVGPDSRVVVQHVVADAGHGAPVPSSDTLRRLHDLYPSRSSGAVEYRLSAGNPVEEICRAAEDTQCDLIVMASHGRTGVGRLLLGSVAESVFRHVIAPVVLVHGSSASAEPIPGTALA
jgi:nucleotide-binding universal stress UspA family protein